MNWKHLNYKALKCFLFKEDSKHIDKVNMKDGGCYLSFRIEGGGRE